MCCAVPCCAVLGEMYGNATCLQALKSKLQEQKALAEDAASKLVEQEAMHSSMLGAAQRVNTLASRSCIV